MAADVSRNADWRKYLIYLNLALATLAPSNANAQNTDTDTIQPKKPKITLASLKEKAIKVVDGTSVIRGENGKVLVIDNVLSPEEKEQIKDNISKPEWIFAMIKTPISLLCGKTVFTTMFILWKIPITVK